MPNLTEILKRNLSRVRGAIEAACARCSRDPAGVRLVAVTKSVGFDAIRALLNLGVCDLGENRVQQLVDRAEALPGDFDADFDAAAVGPVRPCWHMIGHLQRNKARALLRASRIVHSLDSVRLAAELQAQAEKLAACVDVFVEVNVAGESQKHGAALGELRDVVAAVAAAPRLRLRGLMTMAPMADDAEASRPHFARLAGLLRELRESGAAPPTCRHLSMGMSHDFAIAVEEGATVVRVGTALFEGLAPAEASTAGG